MKPDYFQRKITIIKRDTFIMTLIGIILSILILSACSEPYHSKTWCEYYQLQHDSIVYEYDSIAYEISKPGNNNDTLFDQKYNRFLQLVRKLKENEINRKKYCQ